MLPVDLAYDTRGRLSTTLQGTRLHAFGYDPTSGYLATTTDPLAHTVLYDRDAVGRVLQQTFPGGDHVNFGYDQAGNMTSLTPPGRPAHGFSYTPVDLVSDYVPPAVAGGGPTHNGYDVDRNLTSILRPDLATIGFGYDGVGRLWTKTIPGGLLTYNYHPTTGRLISLSGPYGVSLGYTFDASLLTEMSWSGDVNGTVQWGYDTDFRIISEKVNNAFEAGFGYDNDGLMTTAGALARTLDPLNGRITASTLGNVTDAYGYDAYGALASYQAQYSGSTLVSVQYTRDELSRITTKTETAGTETHVHEYSYDLRGRLEVVKKDSAVTGHYVYDGNGNRLGETVSGKTGTYDDQDRMLTYGSATYTYTANGELRTRVESGQTTTYSYDVLGNLVRVELPGKVIEYLVDGQGRRVGKKVDGALVRAWLYRDQLRPVAELDGLGNVVARFVYSTRVNVPDYMVKGGSTYRFVHDHLGSVRFVVDAATGTVAQAIEYDAWGKALSDSNPGFQPFGFAGGVYDADTGLVRFGARDYDAEVGRWMGKDPLRFRAQGTNLYGYVVGDPVNRIDPRGQNFSQTLQDLGAAAAAVLGQLGSWAAAGGEAAGGLAVAIVCGALVQSDTRKGTHQTETDARRRMEEENVSCVGNGLVCGLR